MTISTQAPYAPGDPTIQVLERYRDTGFGGRPIDIDLVTRMGFHVEIARRIVQTLRMLDLIGDDGQPTDTFRAFRQASTSEYKQVFASQLYDQYAAVFDVMGRDLHGKTVVEVENHFRAFEPASLRKRMVSLFMKLCQYAEIMEGSPARASGGTSSPRPRGASSTRRPRRPAAPSQPELPLSQDTNGARPPTRTPNTTTAILRSGGSVTLSVSVDLIALEADDRRFVFDLIDKIKGYGNQRALPAGALPLEVAATEN